MLTAGIMLLLFSSPSRAAFTNTAPKIFSIQSYRRMKTIKRSFVASFTDKKCIPGAVYQYCVKAYRMKDGKTQWSSASFPKGVTMPGVFCPKTTEECFTDVLRMIRHYDRIVSDSDNRKDDFGRARLIVKGKNRNLHFEWFGACGVIQSREHFYIVQFPNAELAEAVYNRLRKKKAIIYVEPDRLVCGY